MISYFLITEVKGKTISPVENAANFCLKPAQYLWNGKKVDWIQEGADKAIQIDLIYTPGERSWPLAALMIVLLIPGTILGAALKGYAFCKHHVEADDVFVKENLNKPLSNAVYFQDLQFGEKVSDFIGTLQSTSDLNPAFNDTGKPLFLSEITDIKLRPERHFENYSRLAAQVNGAILKDVHLLWNVSHIDVSDHFARASRTSTEKEQEALIAINPFVQANSRTARAVDFFSI
jgi:hypothetical protein